MGADPEPEEAVVDRDRERAILEADARRPVVPDPLEVQRRMIGIVIEKREVLVGESANALAEAS